MEIITTEEPRTKMIYQFPSSKRSIEVKDNHLVVTKSNNQKSKQILFSEIKKVKFSPAKTGMLASPATFGIESPKSEKTFLYMVLKTPEEETAAQELLPLLQKHAESNARIISSEFKAKGNPKPAKSTTEAKNKPGSGKGTGIGCLVVVVILIIIGIIGAITGSGNNDEIEALVMSHHFAKKKLLSPATAEFANYGDPGVIITDCDNGKFIVAAYVDSQNVFGAMLRQKYICIMQKEEGGKWALEEFAFHDLE